MYRWFSASWNCFCDEGWLNTRRFGGRGCNKGSKVPYWCKEVTWVLVSVLLVFRWKCTVSSMRALDLMKNLYSKDIKIDSCPGSLEYLWERIEDRSDYEFLIETVHEFFIIVWWYVDLYYSQYWTTYLHLLLRNLWRPSPENLTLYENILWLTIY